MTAHEQPPTHLPGTPPPVLESAHLATLRRALVEGLQGRGVITDPRVAAAFDRVPRHLFLPGVGPEQAYSDRAIMTKEQDGIGVSSSSQPSMMAIMIQQSLIEPGQRILEIGAGTGYNAAILRELVGPRGLVITIDVDQDIADAARAGLRAASYPDVRVLLGDGGYGWPRDAPYDRLLVTVGASDLPPAWVAQVRPNGILTVPLAIGVGEFSTALRKQPDGTLVSESLTPCAFVRLRGAFVGTERIATVGEWTATFEESPRLDPARLPALLDAPIGEETLPGEVMEAAFFLAFCGEPTVRLWRRAAPEALDTERWRFGPLDTAAMSGCLLAGAFDPGARHAAIPARLYGSRAVYGRTLRHLDHWRALGRPTPDDLRILVYPQGGPPPPTGAMMIVKPASTLVLADRAGRPYPAAG